MTSARMSRLVRPVLMAFQVCRPCSENAAAGEITVTEVGVPAGGRINSGRRARVDRQKSDSACQTGACPTGAAIPAYGHTTVATGVKHRRRAVRCHHAQIGTVQSFACARPVDARVGALQKPGTARGGLHSAAGRKIGGRRGARHGRLPPESTAMACPMSAPPPRVGIE